MDKENFSIDLKIRVNPTQDEALERLAGKRVTKKATIARQAIQEYLARELPGYPDRFKRSEATQDQQKKAPARRKEKRARLTDIREVSLSIVDSIPAGWPDDRRAMKPKRTLMVAKGKYPAGAFGLEVTGESMNKAMGVFGPITNGTTVILLPPDRREAKHGDIVAALCDGQTTLKRLDCKLGPDCVLRAESDDPAWKNCIKPAHDLEIQGVVIGKL